MDERPDNHMDKVLRANREKAHSHMELITADGHHVANVAPTLPLEPGPLVFWGTRVFLRVEGLRNVWRETSGTVVAEV